MVTGFITTNPTDTGVIMFAVAIPIVSLSIILLKYLVFILTRYKLLEDL